MNHTTRNNFFAEVVNLYTTKRRWARAWKCAVRAATAATEERDDWLDEALKRIQALEEALRPFAVENMDHWHMEECAICNARRRAREVLGRG